jgi:hypothetical protein
VRYVVNSKRWDRARPLPYVEGLGEGLLEGITVCLKVRFGAQGLEVLPALAQGLELLPAIQRLEDIDRLRAILKAIETATDLDDLPRQCASALRLTWEKYGKEKQVPCITSVEGHGKGPCEVPREPRTAL